MRLTNTPQPASLRLTLDDLPLDVRNGKETMVNRVLNTPIDPDTYELFRRHARGITVGPELERVVTYFKTPDGHTPAGFRRTLALNVEGTVCVDLVRDISCDVDGTQRPTQVLYSADSANPYEVAHVAPFVANLTCNPGIIYDLFLNNPEANVGGHFTDRDEVMAELGNVLGPGADISVELNNPFEDDFGAILEEAERFREILSPWRVVIKVPHTGPVNAGNVGQLLTGDKRLNVRYSQGTTEDRMRGHHLAMKLREEGFRVNFTLMFEPYQAQMALQARPYFINAFVRHRRMQTTRMAGLMHAYAATGDDTFLKDLRAYMLANDYLASHEDALELHSVRTLAESILHQRGIDEADTDAPLVGDGLDSARHCLRVLRQANLPDTRLIICSMEGELNYPDIDRLLVEEEFADLAGRVVVTAEPQYLARFTSTNQVISYQRRFMAAAAGQS